MRRIIKSSEPACLVTIRTAETTDLATHAGAREAFDQLDKPAVRKALVAEQAGLCAFCMRHIDSGSTDARDNPSTMKIAHRTPVAVDSTRALTWTNLLGSCDGGQRSGGRYRTCDLAQEDKPLTVDPTSPGSVARLRYERRAPLHGIFITSEDEALRGDVDQKTHDDGRAVHGTLALNAGELPVLREQAWKAFQELQRRRHPTQKGKAALRQFLPQWLAHHGSRAPEFLGVIEYKVSA